VQPDTILNPRLAPLRGLHQLQGRTVTSLASDSTRSRSGWQRWPLRLAVLLILLVGVFLFVESLFDARLRRAIAELDAADPGWRFDDILAAREEVAAEENSAPLIVAAAELLPEDWPGKDFSSAFSDLPPAQRLGRADHARLCNELNEWEAALIEARKVADRPRGRHRVDLTRPNLFATSLVDQQNARKVASLLQYDAIRMIDEGKLNEALVDCRAIVNVGRSMGDEPFAISQLIRTACIVLGCKTTARLLSQGEIPPEELAALQELLETDDSFPDELVGARGERAAVHEMFTALETGQLPFSAAAGGRPNGAEKLLNPVLQPGFRYEHPEMLSIMTRYVEASRLPMHERHAVETAIDNDVRALPRTAVLTRLLIPALYHVSGWHLRKHALLRCTIVCLASERYRRAHGRWPDTLTDLLPAELSAVPLDPFDGQPLRYVKAGDGITVYSVGPDQTDDGGTLVDESQPNKPGTDIGVHIPDPGKRRQPPAKE
jgi:hypothetical protein